MERYDFSSGKPTQLTLSLTERSTVFVFQQKGQNQTEQKLPRIKPEDRFVHPVGVLALMQDYLDFGKEDIDTLGNETKFAAELRRLRGQGVSIEDVKEDIGLAVYEAPVEGRKWKSKPAKLNAFVQMVDTMVDDAYTEPIQEKKSA